MAYQADSERAAAEKAAAAAITVCNQATTKLAEVEDVARQEEKEAAEKAMREAKARQAYRAMECQGHNAPPPT